MTPRSLPTLTLVLLAGALAAQAPFTPGARYREHVWTTPGGQESFLRVGGRYGYASNPGTYPSELQDGDQLILPDSLVLDGAAAATLTLEKVMSHEDTRGLTVSVNGNAPIAVPEPADVPAPQPDYMYHTDVEVDVPLEQLRAGRGNRFVLSVDTAQRWGWPQNIIYAATWRIYYDLGDVGVTAADLPRLDYAYAEVPQVSTLRVSGARPNDEAVDYVLVGRNVDWSGRGVHTRTHYQTYRGEPHHTLGRLRGWGQDRGLSITWDARWLPEQDGADLGVQARILGADGVWRVGPVHAGLTLAERPYDVHLLSGESAPANWVTRADTFEQAFDLPIDPESVDAYRLHWTSWSPCYANGLTLNGHLLWMRGGDCYAWDTHAPVYDEAHELHFLQRGRNVIATGLTPLMHGEEMVHGMEVQWPGVQVLARVVPD